MPRVSIITVTHNAKEVIEPTLQSIASLTYPDIECIIVDGASTDGTLDILRRYKDRIDRLHSAPDRGIYDAMNTGVQLSSGEWVHFLNAGDTFAEPDILQKILAEATPETGVLYGPVLLSYKPEELLKHTAPLDQIWRGLPFNHQGSLVRRNHMLQNPFVLRYPVSAVYDVMFTLWKNGIPFTKVDTIVAHYAPGGNSEQKLLSRFVECMHIAWNHEKSIRVLVFHTIRLLLALPVKLLQIVLPSSCFARLMQLRIHIQNFCRS